MTASKNKISYERFAMSIQPIGSKRIFLNSHEAHVLNLIILGNQHPDVDMAPFLPKDKLTTDSLTPIEFRTALDTLRGKDAITSTTINGVKGYCPSDTRTRLTYTSDDKEFLMEHIENKAIEFSANETGEWLEDGTVEFNDKGLTNYIFDHIDDFISFFLNSDKNVPYQYQEYVGSRETGTVVLFDHVDPSTKIDDGEDGDGVYSAWSSNKVE
tara:strand:+ start:1965 stop:2603 length:639 start_codon:yes stop_codon:yes gene_type:complete